MNSDAEMLLPYPRADDVVTSRPLSAEEVGTLAQLAVSSDLYSGGHVGNFGSVGSEGPWERLEVRCCGCRQENGND
jgi:hypothetical protein